MIAYGNAMPGLSLLSCDCHRYACLINADWQLDFLWLVVLDDAFDTVSYDIELECWVGILYGFWIVETFLVLVRYYKLVTIIES